jgi:hypothetical protein
VGDAKHEIEQVVGFFLPVAKPSSPASLVRFIQDDRAEFSLRQQAPLFRIVENQPCGDNRNAKRAASDIFGTARFDRVPLVIHPNLLGGQPDSAGNTQFVLELHLPLEREGGRA